MLSPTRLNKGRYSSATSIRPAWSSPDPVSSAADPSDDDARSLPGADVQSLSMDTSEDSTYSNWTFGHTVLRPPWSRRRSFLLCLTAFLLAGGTSCRMIFFKAVAGGLARQVSQRLQEYLVGAPDTDTICEL